MMKNCSYQSGNTMVVYEDGLVKIKFRGSLILQISGDEFVDFWAVTGKMAAEIMRHSPAEMGWKPEGHSVIVESEER